MADLNEGLLSEVRELIRSDTSVCLEIRNNYINIYYRGGNMMKISAPGPIGEYSVEFDKNYFRYIEAEKLPLPKVKTSNQVECWLASVPRLKRAMDSFFGKHKKEEREFQQEILRDNNFSSISKGTDYYICDIEYANQYGQFDMIGVHWPSRERRNTHDRRLVFVEVKNGDNALQNGSGISKHVADINDFVEKPEALEQLKEEMVDIFKQKSKLGFIKCTRELTGFNSQKPLLLLALVNHNPNSRILRKVLCNLPNSPNVDLCIATASFLGYGLYDPGIHPLDQAWTLFGEYIHQT